MCGCEFNYVCSRCAGTPADPGYLLLPDPRVEEEERRDRDRSTVEFLKPLEWS